MKIKYNQPIINEQRVELDLYSHLYAFCGVKTDNFTFSAYPSSH